MKNRHRSILAVSISLFALSIPLPASSTDSPERPASALASSEGRLAARAFVPAEIKQFFLFYPDLEYSALYDLETNDWRIDLTADLYFERTAKPKAKKSATLYWAGGRLLPKEELPNKERYWVLRYRYSNTLRDPATYTQEEIDRIRNFGSSENRKSAGGTPMFFFDFLYSAQSRAVIEEHIIRTTFLGKPTRIHERIYTPVKNAERKILEAAALLPEQIASAADIAKISLEAGDDGSPLTAAQRQVREFVVTLKSADAYYWREIAGTSRKSFHSYGIALDVLPKRLAGRSIYWAWEKERSGDKWMLVPPEKRWTPGDEVIRIFEEEGFIWGGYWIIFDNMHFEYHPELTGELRLSRSSPE